ncbi:hypothetical protein RclHR1_04010002 [Rhizophagus clarus]|uniref:BZIP domain-containing protein n=1 Tax=Rhizophagus clarus TaxID=94130 RepID=A0A2Z6RRU7_9GLOM|nr:hypothetical protein RclHR1_04010002 [Rhizophagus clarus]GES95516.1 hypothetical protein GLOIN_2v1483350 [Rhizophagus clarus]
MENQSDLFMKTSIDGTNIEPFPRESQQIYQQIDPQFFTDFSFNLPKDVCLVPSPLPVENKMSEPSVAQFAQFQFPTDYYSYPSATVPFFEPLQLNYYYPYYPILDIAPIQDSMAETSAFIPTNYFPPEQNLQYFIVPQIPQQFDTQYSDFTHSSDPQTNFFDSPNSLSSHFVKQSPKFSRPYSDQLNLKIAENLVKTNNHTVMDESKLEKKKLQNRAAAQRAREKEKILIENLRNENESLKKEYEEKIEEMKRLNSILDGLKKKE